MSQPVPPPGNPFAEGATPTPYPMAPPPAPARDNVGLGLVAALVAALVAGGVYGGIAGAVEREIGWAAIGVGFLVGFAAGKVGGRNPVLPVVSAVLSLGAVYCGQLVAIAILGGKELNIPATEMFFEHFDMLTEVWGESKDAMTFLFFALAAFAAFSGSKKAAQ
ncbi:hypothetical protein J7E93_15510 [Streptomyces sp. ISL-36]|uniref:hypothetical protein n=1 Tax=Streptomyces sp. ISL-36 TaxID=2819182 RepID=UPI001BE51858|nr:hypothetical protein [Streptomyces sp. ISL-36]MBT2441496.1 hypothetical protein [Streptomyces sp. ISL-36]